jgi:hypothetical protein
MADEETQVEEEKDLEVLLKTEERFPPPPEFAEQANANDPAIYDEAEADFEAWWEKWAKELDWFEPSRTTAWTVTSKPARATRSPITGWARTARPRTSPTPSCST